MGQDRPLLIDMKPSPNTVGDGVSGIHTVVRAYGRILPKYGIHFVRPGTKADLTVTHAGMGTGGCDVAMLHGIYFTDDYTASKMEWRSNQHVVKSIRSALVVTVPSEWVAETIRRDFRRDPIVLPHGVFVEEWRHNYKHQPKTVLWAKNRIYDVCNPEPINRVAAMLPGYSFYTTFASPGAPKNVHEIGVQDTEAIKKWISKISVVISTVKETWGIMFAEALAAGTPVVSANYGNVPNIVEHGVTGYVYHAGSAEDMANGIVWADKHRDVLSENAKKLSRKLSWENSARRIARTLWAAHRIKVQEQSILPTMFDTPTLIPNET